MQGLYGHTAIRSTRRHTEATQMPGLLCCLSRSALNSRLIVRRSTTLTTQLSQISIEKRIWVGRWLMGCGGLAASTVVIGGLTRLTNSGLSMVDWHLFKEFPPFSEQQWKKEFEKYKKYPEFKLANSRMTLSEFKRIWYYEYIHRSLGRITGLAFFIPATFFWAKRWLIPAMKKRVIFLGGLVLAQGLVGWWMVKSGLEMETALKYNDPRVSHYRLATHLGLAFTFYSLLMWNAFSHLRGPQVVSTKNVQSLKLLRSLGHSSKGLIFLTAISGAFVAGIDAGLIYNSYPKMGDRWIPSDILALSPTWKNFLENPTTTQFDHRTLGHITYATVVATWLAARKSNVPLPIKRATSIVLLTCTCQLLLGITTLLSNVKTEYASSHQAGALITLTTALWLTHNLKYLRK